MRKLYWKIFISFWLASILIIITTVWTTIAHIPWAGLSERLIIAIFISGLICYLLSRYLTKPLHSLSLAAKSLATGKLHTRVGHFAGHNKDEIAELSLEFDSMAEQLETLIISKERLLQDISHELRSPLARLQIAIELGRQKTQALADDEFDRMEAECLRLNILISEILDYARLDQSTNTLNKKATNLPKIITTLVSNANYEFSSDTPRVIIKKLDACQLMLDERLIYRAIENVLRNALQYTPKDHSVYVSLDLDDSLQHVKIIIEDTGPGVPDEQLSKIFNPFYRVDTSRAKKTGGYGLGLAIAKQAIHLHGGSIHASNCVHGGLIVEMILGITYE